MLSDNVVILTRQEWADQQNAHFQRGVERGRHDRGVELNREIDKLQKKILDLEDINRALRFSE